jgi:hypothetical protein
VPNPVSILLQDNAPEEVLELCARYGVLIMFLPAYSPEDDEDVGRTTIVLHRAIEESRRDSHPRFLYCSISVS